MNNAGYVIFEKAYYKENEGYCIGFNPKAVEQYVVWAFDDEEQEVNYYWGHYCISRDGAYADFYERMHMRCEDLAHYYRMCADMANSPIEAK